MAVVAAAATPGLAGSVTDPRGDAVVRRVFAGENAGTRRTTNLAGCVTTCELHARGGDAVDVGAFVVSGALIAEIAPAKVVGKNEDDVGPPLDFVGGMNLCLAKRQADEQDGAESVAYHGDSRVKRAT